MTETMQERINAAAAYLQKELEARSKKLGGQADAMCQAYQEAIDALIPKKKYYLVMIESRDAQGYFEPYRDETESCDEDFDEEENWKDVEGSIVYDRICAGSREEAENLLRKKYPEYNTSCFDIEEYLLP